MIAFADQQTVEKRIAECNNCEFYRVKLRQCRKCGCIMPAKVRLKGAKCPVGKW